MAMINYVFIAFKCNEELFQQEDVDEHTRATHGITTLNRLKPLHIIEIDSKIPFVLNQALDIEQVGPDERGNIFHGFFTRCVARGIVKKSTSKNNADLNENRSSEFMAELKKKHFRYILSMVLDEA